MGVLLLLTTMMLGHYTYAQTTQQEALTQKVSRLTGISSLSLSVAYYEPRILFREERDNPAYPQMQTINKMDMIYAK